MMIDCFTGIKIGHTCSLAGQGGLSLYSFGFKAKGLGLGTRTEFVAGLISLLEPTLNN